jgi:flavin reductase (DIM6/NTAB) family NADH-FMN oxidoreductase RutF
MQHSMAELDGPQRYKLLSSLVVPRPISFVTTINDKGVVNAAPYSFFNVFSEDPPLVVIGIGRRTDGTLKDTALNIEANGEFVVNLVDEGIAHAMNIAATDFPPDQSEIDPAGLDLVASSMITPPRIAQAPAALECRNHTTLLVATDRRLVVGEVLAVHTKPGLIDPANLRLDLDAYRPVGRLFANLYCRTRDTFELVRMSYVDWLKRREER